MVAGGSQGGGLTMVLAGLDRRVAFAAPAHSGANGVTHRRAATPTKSTIAIAGILQYTIHGMDIRQTE